MSYPRRRCAAAPAYEMKYRMSGTPQISVVIPTRHRNAHLRRCLERLAPGAQKLPTEQYEVIVTDDGSTTTAETMVREQFPWVRWVAGPKRGPASNRNHGASLARCQWIAFVDDDCVPEPMWLAEFATACRPTVQVYEGRTTCRAGLTRFSEDAPINERGGCLPSCNFMISRAAFCAVGGFDEHFATAAMEDYDLRERLLTAAFDITFVDSAVVDHPPRPRVTGLALGAQWESHVYFYRKHGRLEPLVCWLPFFILKVRLVEMIHRYRIRDYPRATLSLLGEFAYVIIHITSWERKYSST